MAEAQDNWGTDADVQELFGFTDDELVAFRTVNRAASLMMNALPAMHPMEKDEYAHAIHVLQDKLMNRPIYRKYLETQGHDPYSWWEENENEEGDGSA